jgi:biotin carboxylase
VIDRVAVHQRSYAAARCAVVNAYGIGRFLPAALNLVGVESIHVRSDYPGSHLWHRPGDFSIEVVHEGDVAATAAKLGAIGVDVVVAATESGVILSDALSELLETPGNGTAGSIARRNKYEMVTAIRAAGLAAADSVASASADEVVAWAVRRDGWPVVLKPVESAGTDNVYFCHDAHDIRLGHANILASVDRFGRRNAVAMAQQFLHGDEYFVNTVSRDGIHQVVEVWLYGKHRIDSMRSMVSTEDPVPADDPKARVVADYALSVLDALGIRDWAAHTEIMLTAGGPVLVECGARLGGAHNPDIVSRCIGTSQVDRLALAIARPEAITHQTSYRIVKPLRFVNLIVPHGGVIPAEDGWAPIRTLASFLDLSLSASLPPGTRVGQTVDLASSPGTVYLSHDDAAQVTADYERLRDIERTGLYEPDISTSGI